MSNSDIAQAPTQAPLVRTPSVGNPQQAFDQLEGRTSSVDRAKGPAETPLRKRLVAWRPQVLYLGSISEDTEVGLGTPPESGVLFTRLSLRVRENFEIAEATWSIEAGWRDADLSRQPLGTITTANQSFTAHQDYEVFHNAAGVRLEHLHEVTVKFTGNGTPSALSQVTLYADWYVGI